MFHFKLRGSKPAALFLSAALLLSSIHWTPPAAAANEWMQDSLDKLTNWGVVLGDEAGGLNLDAQITRAEFTAMVNRAYGYTETTSTPFNDVLPSAWYADDISIGYNTGYFSGTSPTTASPGLSLTREQAIAVLARNLRLEESTGEVTEFTDGHDFSSWSRGYVKSAVNRGLVNGYDDSTCRPQNNITRGEMIKLLGDALGTLINTEGSHYLGGVVGNVTVSTPNVTLHDTTIAGDLYLTGGVGLGDVILENVDILGRIIVSGGGESERGDSSILLRNVNARELLVDSLAEQYVSISVQNDTTIEQTTLRSNAFIEDNTLDGRGLLNINLDSPLDDAQFNLAGNLKTVINRTPDSTLNIARGKVLNLTIDEHATDSQLNIAIDATATTLNLDTGIRVTGQGDIGNLVVSASGSSTEMLPDNITIRPGVSASIAGETMDTVLGEESSDDPRLLAGYPRADDVAPTSLEAIFSANKSGTVYWAVTPMASGYVEDADTLIKPPTYGPTLLRRGTVNLTASDKETSTKITGLTMDGNYYLSAVLVDSREQRSLVKHISFSTPDNTVPAFATGHPYLSQITNIGAQVTAMTTKSCKLYYALLPSGSTAPRANDFLTESITGLLGFGSVDMIKNAPETFWVNDDDLEEVKTYDLYLWLTDADSGLSSAVRKITFTTVDKTPPEFVNDLHVSREQATSISLTGAINEAGTIYWVAVPEGEEYPKPPANNGIDTSDPNAPDDSDEENNEEEDSEPTLDTDGKVNLASTYAKLQVIYGLNAFKSGRVSARANTDFTFTVSGLTAQHHYDIYYLAVDAAGNYAERVEMITGNTLDNIAPTATQEFTRFSEDDKTAPYANTDINLIFSENVQNANTSQPFLTLYQNVENATVGSAEWSAARDALADALEETVWLMTAATGNRLPERVKVRSSDNENDEDWVIDYRNAKVTQDDDNKLTITFPTTNDNNKDSALNLRSGNTYFFELHDIADTSTNKNRMGVTQLPRFTTIAAQIFLEDAQLTMLSSTRDPNDEGKPIDITFRMTPLSTSTMDDETDWDMLMWMDMSCEFDLFRRERTGNVSTPWENIGSYDITTPSNGTMQGISIGYDRDPTTNEFPQLNTTLLEDTIYEYAIHFTRVDDLSDRDSWSSRINFRTAIMAGSSARLNTLSNNVNNYDDMVAEQYIADITSPKPFTLICQFTDHNPPVFTNGYPQFVPGDTSAHMNVMLNRTGTVYYAVAPVEDVDTGSGTVKRSIINTVALDDANNSSDGLVDFNRVPQMGGVGDVLLEDPSYLRIVNPNYSNNRIKTGTATVSTDVAPITVTGLEADTDYYVYFVIRGEGQTYSKNAYIYKFHTENIVKPIISLSRNNPSVTISTDREATVHYLLVRADGGGLPEILRKRFSTVANNEWLSANPNSTMTVLEALNTDVRSGNKSTGSVFDLYAMDNAKEELANYIRSQGYGSGGTGSTFAGPASGVEVTPEKSVPVNCERPWPLDKSAQYAFLAVGRSPLGSGDAFRATYYITVVDQEAPLVTGITPSIIAVGNLAKGDLTLQFDEPLYFRSSSGDAQDTKGVDLGSVQAPGRLDDFISVQNTFNSSSAARFTVYTDDRLVNQNTQTVRVEFEAIPDGTYGFSFLGSLCDRNGNTRAPLNIRITISTNAAGGKEMTYTIPKEWNGGAV